MELIEHPDYYSPYDLWEKEIDDLKNDLFEKLSQIVLPEQLNSFAMILSFAFFEEEENSINLCKKHEIGAHHFYALTNKKDKLIDTVYWQ